uniref:Uncharacterized protein n=1 Tax=viral metagenome TaxID=1070528 RepID=A0A6C0EYK3_9ZZZZ
MRKGQYPPQFNVKKAYNNAQRRKQNALLKHIPQGTFVQGRMVQRLQTHENKVHAMRNPTFHKGTGHVPSQVPGYRLSTSPGRPYAPLQAPLQAPLIRPSVHVPIQLPVNSSSPTRNPLMNGLNTNVRTNGTRRSPSRSPSGRTSRSHSKNKTNKSKSPNRGVTRTNSKGRRHTNL